MIVCHSQIFSVICSAVYLKITEHIHWAIGAVLEIKDQKLVGRFLKTRYFTGVYAAVPLKI